MGALGRKCIDQIEVGVRKGGSRPKDFPSVCRRFA